jgi:hypothetical protein
VVERYQDIKSAWWLSFTAGVFCSLIEAVVDPDGWAWTSLRAIIAAVWLALFVLLVAGWYGRRRSS